MFQGVTSTPKEDGTSATNITINFSDKKDDEAASSQALILSLVAASRNLEKWKDKSDAQWFADAFENVLAIQGELDAKAKKKDPSRAKKSY